jgi:hypothetical protein
MCSSLDGSQNRAATSTAAIFAQAMRSAPDQRRAALRTPADRNLHQRIVPKIVLVDRILVAAGNRRDGGTCHSPHVFSHSLIRGGDPNSSMISTLVQAVSLKPRYFLCKREQNLRYGDYNGLAAVGIPTSPRSIEGEPNFGFRDFPTI